MNMGMEAAITLQQCAAIQVAPADNVAVLLQDASAGARISIGATTMSAAAAICAGHKVALTNIEAGAPVIKYGAAIGRASSAISAGDWVHSHNLRTALTPGLAPPFAEQGQKLAAPEAADAYRTFQGFRRADGGVGTRNEIWVIATVGCVTRLCQRLAAEAMRCKPAGIDGVYALTHPFGCSQLGEDLDGARVLLAALAAHPNAAGVLIVGLGCESNSIAGMLDALAPETRAKVRAFAAQDETDELAAGLDALEALLHDATQAQRSVCPLSALTIGLKCGGSDGFSGLTANPLLGRAAERITASGGGAILTEIPEIFGAEHVLLARARNDDVRQSANAMIDDFKSYFVAHGQPISENPSPGNIAGGITTLEEKSLGAVQKSGASQLCETLRYGARKALPGLSLLESPGNDAVSSTALAAAGANVILFTTGRGTPMGFPVPTIKVSSNSALAARKPHWIDFDAGVLLGDAPPGRTTDRFLDFVLDVASGKRTKAEQAGEREIALWKRGVTL